MLKFKTFETSKEFEKWQKDNKQFKIEILHIYPVAINSIGNTTQTEHEYGIMVVYKLIN